MKGKGEPQQGETEEGERVPSAEAHQRTMAFLAAQLEKAESAGLTNPNGIHSNQVGYGF